MSVAQILARVIPTCFVVGCGVEIFMVNVDINGTTFYGTAIRKEAERRDEALRQRIEFHENKTKNKNEIEERRKAAMQYIGKN
mgnify:CR=1 FL=1|jgi:hypothetical protein